MKTGRATWIPGLKKSLKVLDIIHIHFFPDKTCSKFKTPNLLYDCYQYRGPHMQIHNGHRLDNRAGDTQGQRNASQSFFKNRQIKSLTPQQEIRKRWLIMEKTKRWLIIVGSVNLNISSLNRFLVYYMHIFSSLLTHKPALQAKQGIENIFSFLSHLFEFDTHIIQFRYNKHVFNLKQYLSKIMTQWSCTAFHSHLKRPVNYLREQ